MELLRIVWRDYRWPFVAVVLLSLTSAGLGIGVIAFINQRLLGTFTDPWRILPEFLGLIALLNRLLEMRGGQLVELTGE